MLDWLAGLPWAEHGAGVGACLNGEQALRLAREDMPVLLLTDIVMPLLYGLGLTRARSHKARDPGDPLSSYGRSTTRAPPCSLRAGLSVKGYSRRTNVAVVDQCRQTLSDHPPHRSVSATLSGGGLLASSRLASDAAPARASGTGASESCMLEAPETQGIFGPVTPKPASWRGTKCSQPWSPHKGRLDPSPMAAGSWVRTNGGGPSPCSPAGGPGFLRRRVAHPR
jgi:hypothetical protein